MLQVYPHGSTDSLPYCTMGSGSLNAMAVFEDGFQEDMGVEDAKKLVSRAIRSGIYNDLGSGSNVDLCIIYKDKVSQTCSPLCVHLDLCGGAPHQKAAQGISQTHRRVCPIYSAVVHDACRAAQH